MGADGYIICVKREDWDREVAHGVLPGDLGLYHGDILGVPAVWGYAGDNMIEWTNFGQDFYLTYDSGADDKKADADTTGKRRAALEWFNENAEWHEVWT